MQKKNPLFIVILFSIFLAVRPISYEEMRNRHPTSLQKTEVVSNKSSILTQNDELGFLEGNGQVELAKGVEGFPVTPSYPGRRSQGGKVPVGSSKPTRRVPSLVYRTAPKVNNGLYGAPGGGGGPGDDGEGDPSNDSSNSGKPDSKSDEQCQDREVGRQTSKQSKSKRKRKKKSNSRDVSKEITIQAYKDFMLEMSRKGFKVDFSLDRFLELAINPQTGKFDEGSIYEAKGGLQGEAEGMYKDLRRTSNKAVDLDFEATDIKTGSRIFVDHKGMIDFESLEEEGRDISGFPSHIEVAYDMGKESAKQKKTFIGKDQGPKSTNEVLHLVNFDKIRDPSEKPSLISAVLDGAEDAGCVDGIVFINYK